MIEPLIQLLEIQAEGPSISRSVEKSQLVEASAIEIAERLMEGDLLADILAKDITSRDIFAAAVSSSPAATAALEREAFEVAAVLGTSKEFMPPVATQAIGPGSLVG